MRQSRRHPNTFNFFSFRTEYCKNYFFTSVHSEWNKRDSENRTYGSCSIIWSLLSKFIRPKANKIYNINKIKLELNH